MHPRARSPGSDEEIDPEQVPLKTLDKLESGEPASPPPPSEEQKLSVFGWDLTLYSRTMQFSILSLLVFFFFMVCSWMEEYMFKSLPSFRFGWYLTFFELLCFTGFSAAERKAAGQNILEHKATLIGHWIIAVAMTVARGLTNVSLQYLNYPTQVIFKSMKLITVMIGSVFLLRKSYTKYEYASVAMLVSSAVLFSLGDVDVAPEASTYGLVVVLLSLVFDSVHSNAQEVILRSQKAPTSEVMFFSNAFAAICSFLVCLFSGELFDAYAFGAENPILYVVFVARSIVIFCGVQCFLTMMKHFGAVSATTVTTVRKILTILASFVFFPKPFTIKYFYGIVMFVASVVVSLKAPKA